MSKTDNSALERLIDFLNCHLPISPYKLPLAETAETLIAAARKEHEQLKEKAWMYDDLCK